MPDYYGSLLDTHEEMIGMIPVTVVTCVCSKHWIVAEGGKYVYNKEQWENVLNNHLERVHGGEL